MATLWPLHFSVRRWRAETEARAAARAAAAATAVTNGDGDRGTDWERARAAGELTPDVNGGSASENIEARGDGNGDDGSDDDEAPASHEGWVCWRSCNEEGGSHFSKVWMQVKGSTVRWYE